MCLRLCVFPGFFPPFALHPPFLLRFVRAFSFLPVPTPLVSLFSRYLRRCLARLPGAVCALFLAPTPLSPLLFLWLCGFFFCSLLTHCCFFVRTPFITGSSLSSLLVPYIPLWLPHLASNLAWPFLAPTPFLPLVSSVDIKVCLRAVLGFRVGGSFWLIFLSFPRLLLHLLSCICHGYTRRPTACPCSLFRGCFALLRFSFFMHLPLLRSDFYPFSFSASFELRDVLFGFFVYPSLLLCFGFACPSSALVLFRLLFFFFGFARNFPFLGEPFVLPGPGRWLGVCSFLCLPLFCSPCL